MSSSAPSRWLPHAPRAALVVVPAAAVAALSATGRPGPAGLVLAVLLLAATGLLLGWRTAGGQLEQDMWSRLLLSGGVLATGVLGTVSCALVPGWEALGGLPLAAATALAFPGVYGGLLKWNRYSTSVADPNDVLNGFSGVLVAVAIGNVLVDDLGGPLAALPDWRLQPLLLAAAAAVVCLGTAWVMTVIAALRSDPRIWLVSGALTAVSAGVGVGLATADGAPLAAAAVVAAGLALLAVAAVRQPPRSTPQPADPADSTVGAVSIIGIATLTLAVAAVTTASWPAIVGAGLAAVGSSLRLLVNVRDLSELATSRREALTDELTSLPNRRAVLRRIEHLCTTGTPFALGLVDLDKFKEVNDGLGHAAGDDLLRMIARRLEQTVPAGALVGRLGGDEFAVIAPLTGGTTAEVTGRLGAGLVGRFTDPFEVAGLELHADLSVGLTAHEPDGHLLGACATLLLRRADAALYDAKRAGASAVVWDSARHVDTSGRLALVEELRTGMARGELVLHYQPQVAVRTGRTVGVEALVRWQHPARGLLPPAEFLPAAELHGLMGQLTETVLAQSVAQAAAWHREGRDLRVSVNLSVSNLLDRALPGRVAGLLAAHGLPSSALVLEVTETVLMSDPESSLAVLDAIAALGIAVSIDDFGTGYASLSYLRQLPVSELKLDRSFTQDLLTDGRTDAIVSGTIDMAHRLGLRVVAEGVEHLTTLRRLEALGCDESQGYLHSRPVPATAIPPAAPAPLLQPA
ncbi:putative bifunctional diguanylate cyclase/phosphodiesterase [Modestobacter sp. SSW1-42]|uniref:putative bifunctional diguanylate cyclase/phosphodiesterase n=1 Tax=Modestobacter sp. SSW1-42 TaxID=596372 RepID=UPI00398744CD